MEVLHVFHMSYQSLTRIIITCKTFSKSFTVYLFSKWMMYLNLFTDLYSHECGSDKIIQGARAQAHIDHNIEYSCIFSHRGDISIKSEMMSITY